MNNSKTMGFTYKELEKNISSLTQKHLITLDFDEVQEDPAKIEMEEFKHEIKAIVDSIITSQIHKNPIAGKVYHIPQETILKKDTLFGIYSEVNSLMRQNILLKLFGGITQKSEHEIIQTFIEGYEMYGMKEVKFFIQETQLKSKIPDTFPLYDVIVFIEQGDDLYAAIKKALVSRGINPEDEKIKEENGYGFQIRDFVKEFNNLLLEQLDLNPHLIMASSKHLH